MGLFKFLLRVIAFILRVIVGGGVLGFASLSLLALTGYWWPLADALNHFQPIWFFGLIALLTIALLVLPYRAGRNFVLLVGFSGLIATAVPLLGEVANGYANAPSGQAEASGGDAETPRIHIESRNVFGRNYAMTDVAAAIMESDPDMLVFQEYFREQSSRLHGLISTKYPYSTLCQGGKRAVIALYAKKPYALHDETICPTNTASGSNFVAQIVATFGTGESAFSVVTTHLNWPVQVSVLRNQSLDMSGKIAAMTQRKQGEWSALTQSLAKIEGPIILLGDFNSTPWSFEMRQFEADADLRRHSLNMATYPSKFYVRGWRDTLPILPLDHVFTRGEIAMHVTAPIAANGSDHLGLSATFSVANE